MLECRDLSVFYGNHQAVDGISININAEEIVAILGANGAGKSTILKAISGIIDFDDDDDYQEHYANYKNEVLMDNVSIFDWDPHDVVELGLSMVPEGRELFGELTVTENLELGAHSKRARGEKTINLDKVMTVFPQLKDRRNQITRTMSGGEQQMVAVGRAMMSSPKILMLDEPSLGLSPLLCSELFKALIDIRETGVGILLVEQNAKQSLAIADRGYLLENGRITGADTASGLANDQSVMRAYLGAGVKITNTQISEKSSMKASSDDILMKSYATTAKIRDLTAKAIQRQQTHIRGEPAKTTKPTKPPSLQENLSTMGGDTYPVIRAAAVHAASVFLDREASTDKACKLIEEAAEGGAQLIAFPETFIPGYPFWIWTHTPTNGAPLFAEYFANSVELDSDCLKRIGAAARKAGAHVVMGINERKGGTLYNTQVYFDNQGNIIGRHRKLQPTHVERTIWGRGDGSDLMVFDTDLGKIGGLICWEHTMDLVRYSLASQGEQIHIGAWPGISALTHDPNSSGFNDVTASAARNHAWSAQTFVVNVQSCIDETVISKLGFEGNEDMMRIGGGWSAIIAPNGQFISGPHTDTETILYGDLDMQQIVYLKYACDSIGHYSRPDVVRLAANYKPQSIIQKFEETNFKDALADSIDEAGIQNRTPNPPIEEDSY